MEVMAGGGGTERPDRGASPTPLPREGDVTAMARLADRDESPAPEAAAAEDSVVEVTAPRGDTGGAAGGVPVTDDGAEADVDANADVRLEADAGGGAGSPVRAASVTAVESAYAGAGTVATEAEVDTALTTAEEDTAAPGAGTFATEAEVDAALTTAEEDTAALHEVVEPVAEKNMVEPAAEKDMVAPVVKTGAEADVYLREPNMEPDKDDTVTADAVALAVRGCVQEETEPTQVDISEVDAGASTSEAVVESHRSVYMNPGSPASSRCSSPLNNIKEQAARHVRSNSFQRFRKQIQCAWRWGPRSVSTGGRDHVGAGSHRQTREQSLRATMNLEVMANQKRQWYRIKSKARDHKEHSEPTTLFEHFFIVGLHSYANVEVIEDAFAKRKTWESEVAKSEILDLRKLKYDGRIPTLEPQILFKYPPGKRVEMRESELPAFCFPEGVKARLMERTPSMSDMNEIVFGQEHLSRDDLSFIFCLKGSDNAPLYGVCLHVQEIVQRAPGILGAVSPIRHSSWKPSRFLISAPRCYCILTRVPFFELHYEMLNSIIAQERLDRITNYVSEMALLDSIPHGVTRQEQQNENTDSPDRQFNDLSGYAIPVDSISGFLSPSGRSSERESLPFLLRSLEPQSPESVSTSENSDYGHLREMEMDNRRFSNKNDDCTSETSGSRSDSFERLNGCFENGETSPEVGIMHTSNSVRFHHTESSESAHMWSVKDGGSDNEDDELNSKNELNIGDEKIMGWAKAHKNEALQIVCGYHLLSLPQRGGEIVFHPLEHLQPIKYCRPAVSFLGLSTIFGEADPSSKESGELSSNKVNSRLAAAEEAFALSLWTIATVCRSLSLESVLTLFAGALLEKQVIIICPNLGVLSAIVLSVIPMIRPFQWQSLLLPVLPRKMLDFLDAPVPFIVGIQHKSADTKMKTANLIRINVNKDKVKACSLPQLPRYKELISDLGPIHAILYCENSTAKRHPIYKCSEVQAEAAGKFLNVMRCYLESLCSNLRSHTITNVQSNNDKVSLLLKESFVDSFPVRDQPFIKLFIETQLFSVLSDSQLSRYENEHSEYIY